jgi:DNA-binding response OmpR family regulator
MKKILLIEDDKVVSDFYRAKLASEDFEVETAFNGESGFECIKTFQPDVIILDLMLPKMSGLEVLQQIRAREDMKHLPVIVFSNTYLSNMVQQAWKAGATKCLSKASSTPKQVIDVVRGLGSPKGAAGTSASSSTTTHTRGHGHPKSGGHGKTTAAEAEAETSAQTELRHNFFASVPATLAASRSHLQMVVKTTVESERVKYAEELYRRIHTLTSNAGLVGVSEIAQMADALEALLKELCEKPKSINASTLRTVAMALDFLGVLFEHGKSAHVESHSKANPRILVVDDEAISRRAITYALEKAKLPCAAVENPDTALKLLAENQFDLVFLDVDMPVMSGFEVCTKLRAFARNKNTPVVFVTSLNDFESRAHSTMSGGNDLIAKPFLFMELAVKALVYVLRGKLAKPAK